MTDGDSPTLPRPVQWLATVRVAQGKVRVTDGESVTSRGENFLRYPLKLEPVDDAGPGKGATFMLTTEFPPGQPCSVHLRALRCGEGHVTGHHVLLELVRADDPDEVLLTMRWELEPRTGDSRTLSSLLLRWGGAV